MEVLYQKIESILAAHTGRWGIKIINKSTGDKLEINPDMVFPAASMIKVPIMYEIMRQAAAGSIDLETSLVVTNDVRVGGAGILQELRADITMTVRELVTLMIVLSDNTATNMLIDLIGMDAVNITMSEIGLKSTILRRKMMDFDSALLGNENVTCASDVALLFGIIENHQNLPSEYTTLMMEILKRQQVRDKLPFHLPAAAVLANKTGTLVGVEHDGGILFLPSGTYIISILTADLEFNYQGLQLVAAIGKVIYEHYLRLEEE